MTILNSTSLASYLAGWTDPQALSQVLGSLIGAGIAIGLWSAERKRLNREKAEETAGQRVRFRSAFLASIGRVRREFDAVLRTIDSIKTSLRVQAEAGKWDRDGVIQSIAAIPLRYPINLPNVFEFSERHLTALEPSEIDALQYVKDEILEYHLSLRELVTGGGSPSTAQAQVDGLDILDGNTHEVIRRLDVLADDIKAGG